MLSAPSFWNDSKSILSILLLPISWLYQIIVLLRHYLTTPYTTNVPVICIGNATMGGSGKTPVAISIAQFLIKTKKKVVFLSKGYGGDITSATLVNTEKHSAQDVGDEPLLLSHIAPVIIAKNRIEGMKLAESQNPDMIIMDDGLQNPTIHKHLSCLVVDYKYGFGNKRTFPSGPLRESIASAIGKTDAVIMIGNKPDEQFQHTQNKPTLTAHIRPVDPLPSKGQNIIAFAGIGRPDKFFDMLKQNGYDLKEKIYFPDHYAYNAADENKLIALASKHNAIMLTTEKDYVKLSAAMKAKTEPIAIRLEFSDNTLLNNLLKPLMN